MLVCVPIDSLLVISEKLFGVGRNIGDIDLISQKIIFLMNKLDMLTLMILVSCIFLYIYKITLDTNIKKFNKICLIIFICDIIAFIISLFLDLNLIQSGAIISIEGMALIPAYIICSLYIVFSIFLCALNYKKITIRHLPLFVTIITFILLILIFAFNPYLTVISIALTIINLTMYFTIENPDLKMLNEFHVIKEKEKNSTDSKNEFLTNITKDIKTPIANIKTISSEALNSNDPEILKQEIRKIQSSVGDLSQLVNNVLDITELEKQKFSIKTNKYQVYNLFNTVNKSFAKKISNNIEYRFNYDKSIPEYLYGDSIRLKQIINILLDNAIEYTKRGYIELNVNSIIKNNICRLIITVEDSGIGMTNEELDHLFDKEKIYSDETLKIIDDTKNNLGVVKSLIDLMNGSITVKSEIGNGSKFTLVVDQIIKEEFKTKIEETVDQYEAMLEKKKKILLVISSTNLSKKINTYLKKQPYDVVEVNGGQYCLEKLRNREKYNIILMEENLEKLSSENTLIKIKDTPGYKIPVILISNNRGFGNREMYQERGFKDVIFMPFQKSEVLESIKKNIN